MKKSLGRTLIFGGVVGALFILSFVSYGIARNIKSDYSKAYVDRMTQVKNKEDAEDALNDPNISDEKREELEAVVAKSQAAIEKDTNIIDSSKKTYPVFSSSAYVLTIGSLASFGICLAISDKIKEKEEEEAAKS